MMKEIFANYNEAQNIINQISEFDDLGMQTIICMLIDTCAAKYDLNACEIADIVCTLVHAVNADLGAYRIA